VGLIEAKSSLPAIRKITAVPHQAARALRRAKASIASSGEPAKATYPQRPDEQNAGHVIVLSNGADLGNAIRPVRGDRGQGVGAPEFERDWAGGMQQRKQPSRPTGDL
jgi:hypothetical protein